MRRLNVRFIKWLANQFGFKIAMIKAGHGMSAMEGDKALLRYVDVIGYLTNKKPLRRDYPNPPPPCPPIKPLTAEQLKELGMHISVDLGDCKNYKEASKVQSQILNNEVKINILKTQKQNGKCNCLRTRKAVGTLPTQPTNN